MADPDVVASMLRLAHEGWSVVPEEVLARTTLADFEAVESLLRSDLDLQVRQRVQKLRECADEAQRFLEARPGWGR